jgi:hypothetical protein
MDSRVNSWRARSGRWAISIGTWPENIKHAQAYGMTAEALAPLERAYADGGRAGVVRLAPAAGGFTPRGDTGHSARALHSEVGEFDEALPHLTRALDAHDPCLVDLAVAPQWDALRAHPEFDACLQRMRLLSNQTAS